MDQREAYSAGGFWADSGGYVNQLLVVPAFTDPATNKPYDAKTGPLVVLEYDIVQKPTGTGICVALFEATAIPANGRAMFSGSPGDPNPKRIYPISGGGSIVLSLSAPWQRFDTGLAIVVSTNYDTITYASQATFIAVRYAQAYVGGGPKAPTTGGAYPQG